MYAKTLIDRAVKVCYGSQSELARRVGVTRQAINAMQKDPDRLSPELAALLAFEVHEDPFYAMAQVAIENAKPDMASRLSRAFHVPQPRPGALGMSDPGDAAIVTRENVTSTASLQDIH